MERYRVLILLLMINVFNYMDRNALAGVSPLIKSAFVLNDVTIGALATAFLLTYTIAAVPFGIWSDLWKPQKVAALGVMIWSIASVATATATSVNQLFIWRSLVGVGEAAYVATAGTLISERFFAEQRSKMLSIFNLGLPLGAALGVLLGGLLGEKYGWPVVFIVVGCPGFILAIMAWLIPDNKSRSMSNSPHDKTSLKTNWQVIRSSLRLPYCLVVVGYIGISYCFGAVINWLPMYMTRIMNYTLGEAATLSGAIIVVAGLCGAPAGGWIADRWYKKNVGGRGYTLLIACLASAIFMWCGIRLNSTILFGISAFFMLWHVGVAAAMVFDTTRKDIWNSASAIAMLFMHLFGDVPSSTVTGILSDHFGLFTAFSLLPIALLLAALAFGFSGYLQRYKKSREKHITIQAE